MVRAAVAACFLLAVCCGHAAAQAPGPSDAAKALAGTWEFANADRDRVCTLTLRTDPAGSALRLDFDRACGSKYAFIGQIAGWTLAENDFLRLVDSSGGTLLEFSEVESGVYEAPVPGEGILFIQKPGSDAAPTRTAQDVTGEWSVVRGGKTICTLTLSDAKAGEDFAVRVRQPCDATIVRFAPAAWQLDRGELLLKPAKGQPWRFEEQDTSTWQRVPATADPILLVRK